MFGGQPEARGGKIGDVSGPKVDLEERRGGLEAEPCRLRPADSHAWKVWRFAIGNRPGSGQFLAPPRQGLPDDIRRLRDLINAHEGIDFRQESG